MTFALRSPLMRPQGIAPGFDPKHVAANGVRLSAIPFGKTFVNLINGGLPGTINGTISAAQTPFGPAVNYGVTGTNFTEFAATIETWPSATFGCIFIPNAVTATGSFVRTSSAGGLFAIGLLAGVPFFIDGGSNLTFNSPAPIPALTAGVPYFFASSQRSGSQLAIVVNLLTGQTWTASRALTLSAVTGTGAFYVTGPTCTSQVLAASIGMPFIGMTELQAWARDPWSFWYPSIGNTALTLPQKVNHGSGVALSGANVTVAAGAVTASGSINAHATGAAVTTAAGHCVASSSSSITTIKAKQFSPSLRSPFVPPQDAGYGLNQTHPASHNARLAAISRADGTMYDLVTNKIGFWSLAGGENCSLGPAAFPASTTSGGMPWPAVVASEVLSNFTMAAIFQHRASAHGQGIVTLNQSNGNGQLTIQANGIIGYGAQGVVAPTFPTATPGHNYFLTISQYNTSGKPRVRGILMDMTTGQFFVADSGNDNYTAPTVGTNYSTLTYNGGLADSNRVCAAMISATALTAAQQLAWAQDPWSFWFKNERVSLIQTAGISRSTGLISGAAVNTAAGIVTVPKNANVSGASVSTAAGAVSKTEIKVLTAGGSVTTAAGTVTVSAAITTNINIVGASVSTSPGTTAETVAKALSGAAVATASGALAKSLTLALTGAAVTTAAGIASNPTNAAISGASVATSPGTLSLNSTLALTGAAATTAAGALAKSLTLPALTGALVTTASGQPGTLASSAIAGSAATVAAGSVKGLSVPTILGASASTAAGPVTESASLALAGTSTATAPGQVAVSVATATSGASVSTAAGAFAKSLAWPAPGAIATTAAGSTSESSTVKVTGASITTAAGSLATAIIPPVVITISGASVAVFAGQVVIVGQTYISGINEGRSLGLDWQSANAALSLGVSR